MSGSASLSIGIAASPAQRRRLAELFGGTQAFLIVSTVEQARRFLGVVHAPDAVLAEAAGAAPPVAVTMRGDGEPVPELSVDSDRRMLRWRDYEIALTPLEHDLMRCLAGTPGQTWAYRRLHREVWGTEHLGRGSDMHSLVRRARRKLARLGTSATIHAVRGVGFRLAAH